ncbi:MAG: hypothetical protein CO186_11235 [Zetaproteobacteria bacterium CG_4_9_14_3_um_filter_49_83]|nr:MAG: hypothetical protein AUJ56_03565 [Zetaproteobacteria bacterium CG1_02_49_23]PIQ34701.1 MAG: hypothetical protein COW62_00920 [Zetaproteobacteria bacterium CG17_big_fil_post_rev_8_21_14_2_50_50_13]PIV29999.1 MAG: hypothetical protein COS35_08940 [Zetaproteobacteria bacterium CG02_land_8_20_14_3_00_50_9]PIY54996.1 MAG: hypothetical protein COZ00_11830 [Zetaproteobacteria bacterium CG_4_10_14_0_8_um_filter_49_80]PJA34284.1 MAG: hypothetical protein CO186_11235 [Zetaproteobacteria bacterium
MLTASSATPKAQHERQRKRIRRTPRPDNWHGVNKGLIEAKLAFKNLQYDQAESLLRGVLEFAPNEAKAWAWLGKILALKQCHDESAQCIERAKTILTRKLVASMSGNKPPVSKSLARILWQQGDYEAARAMLSILLLKQPDDAELQHWQASWNNEVTA